MKKSDYPIKLCSTRAWRTYLGGAMLDELYGNEPAADGHFPEEWIASFVEARNAGREDIKEEGMSRLADEPERTLKSLIDEAPEEYMGAEWVEKIGCGMGALVKLIDSAERLTIQVHPDKAAAKKLFGSDYGKTECWHILGGRIIDNSAPCIYLGFKPGITKEKWKELFDRQDIAGMLGAMHRFEVKTGDTILIEGGVPHAIGAGCFLVEIQEPTDYTIRTEKTTPSGFKVADAMCHQGLGFEKMFDCFHYDGLSAEETRSRWFLKGRSEIESDVCKSREVVGYDDTGLFRLCITDVSGRVEIAEKPICAALYVLDGSGRMTVNGIERKVSKGDQFFIPAGVTRAVFERDGEKPLRLLRCTGPGL